MHMVEGEVEALSGLMALNSLDLLGLPYTGEGGELANHRGPFWCPQPMSYCILYLPLISEYHIEHSGPPCLGI